MITRFLFKAISFNGIFRDYMSNAFAPVGVYLSFWQPSVEAASTQSLQIMLVNDEDREVEGTLTVALENSSGRTDG